MNEIWEVDGKKYEVNASNKDSFLQKHPNAVLVKRPQEPVSVDQGSFAPRDFAQRGFGDTIQTKQEQAILPGTGVKYRSWADEIFPGFDKTLFGRTIAGASGTGESMDLFMEGSSMNEKTLRDFIDANYDAASHYVPSEAMSKFQEKYEAGGKTWTSFFGAVGDDLTIIPELFVQSLGTQIGTLIDSEQAQIAAGTGFTAGYGGTAMFGDPRAKLANAAFGSMASISTIMETSLTFSELILEELKKEGTNRTDENKQEWFTTENVRKLLEGPKGKDIRNKSLGRGLTIGTIEAISGFAAGRVTSQLLKTGPGIGTKLLAIGAGIATEGIGGGIGEVAGRYVAGQEMDVAEIGFEAITGTTTAPLTVGSALLRHKKAEYKLNREVVDYATMKDFVETATDMEIATANISMPNDATGLAATAYEKQTNAQYDSRIDTKVTDTKDRKKLVELQKELAVAERENKATDTPSEVPGAKENLTRIKTEIKDVINKYSGAVGLLKTKLSQKVEAKILENRLDQTIDFLETNKEFVGKNVVIANNTAATQRAYRKAAIEYNKKNPDGKQYNVNDDVSNGDGFIVGDVIVVNKEVARKKGAISVGSHELLHGILAKHMKSLDATGKTKLGKSFMNVLTSEQRSAVTTRLEKQYGLTGDGIYSEVGVQEMFTAFSDAIAKNEITFNEGVFDKLKNVIQEILRVATGGLLVKEFSNGRQAYNFLKDYQNTVAEGGEISNRAKKLAGGGVSVGPVGDRSGSLKSQTEDKASVKKSKAVKAVNDIENVLKERLKKEGKEYTQEEFRNSPEFSQIFDSIYEENGAINNYLKTLGLSEKKFEETRKVASRRLMGYDPQAKRKTGSKEEITVGERIMSDIGFAKLDAAKKLGKESEVENVTKRIDDAQKTKEGDRTFDIEDTSTDVGMKALEEEDLSPAGIAKKKADALKAKQKKYSKFRRNIGIEKGTELYNKILDAARQSLLKAYEIGTPARNIQRKLRDQANRYLFKDIKNFLGTTKYISNLKEYRTFIVDAIFTSDLVQLEKMLPEDQRVFTVFEKELGTKAEVEAAVENNLLPKEALNVIDKGNTVRLYKKVMPTEKQFVAFFNQPAINPDTGARSGLKGTRKDSLARAMAGALSYDATLEVAQTPETMEMRQNYAELKGESLHKDDIDQLASAIGRDKGVLFSSSPDIAAQMAVEIEKNANDILDGKDVLETIKIKGKIIYDLKDKSLKKANGKSFTKQDRQTIASISKNIADYNTYGEIKNTKALRLALKEVVKAKKKGKSIKLGNAFEQLMINQVKSAIEQTLGKKSLFQSTKSYKGKKKGDLYVTYLLSKLGIEIKMDKARGASKTARYKDGEFGFTQNNETINKDTDKKFDDEIMEVIQDQVTKINEFLEENGLDPIGDDYKLGPQQIGLLNRNKHKFGVKGIFLSEEFLGHAYSRETYAKDPQGMIQIGGKLYRMQTGIQKVDDLTIAIATELGIPTLEFTKDDKGNTIGTMEMVGSVEVSSGSLKFRIYPLVNEKNFVDSKANLLSEQFSKKFVRASEKIMKFDSENENITNASETLLASRSSDKPTKGISILDFDDTLATTKSKINFTRPDGTTGTLTPEQYASTYEDLLGLDYKFDFSEFNKVIDGKPAPLLNKAKKLAGKFGTDNMFILTARPQESAVAIQSFLKENGLNIPLKNITGLGNSTAQAKASWVLEKTAEGFNDFYFADDAVQNVKAVKNILDQVDVKSKVQQAKVLFSKSMDKEFNVILDDVTGIDAKTKISGKKAEILGKKKGKFRLFIPPSHEDFIGLLYNFMGVGKKGDQHRNFFEKSLIRPLNRAYRELNTARQSIARDFKMLNKQFKDVKKKLSKEIPGLGFTYENAIRVYLWDKHGHKIPGLDRKEIKELVDVVKKDKELRTYANSINRISKQKKYIKPSDSWTAGDIRMDLDDATGRVGRAQFFKEFQENADMIFSDKNLNKIEAAFGKAFRQALEDSLYRTRTGQNRPSGQNALLNRFMNYINGSVGAVMFVNVRSAVLQQMSIVNFLNFHDNNVFKAAAAFANQKQYWSDWATIFNSDMLKERRGGIKTDVNGAELAASLKGARNTPRALIAKLLELGFLPTQIGDNIAIATGGASFYRNRINTYEKQGLSTKEAEKKAWIDFQVVAESTQQSARPDMVSQQQASPLGKIVLAFQNVTSQFNRLAKKSFLDLKNRRITPGNPTLLQSDISNVSRIVYYLGVQNLIFYSLQTALFAMMFEDDPDEEKFLGKKERIIHGSIDSVLRGSGVFGAILSTAKNAIRKYNKERDKDYNPDESAVLLELLNLGVPLGIKGRKVVNAEKTLNYNKDVIEEMEYSDQDNPMFSAYTSQIEAVTNIPVNRLYNKVRNVRDALNSDYTNMQRTLLLLGWSRYNLGIEDTKIKEVKEDIKEKKKEEKKSEKKKETKTKKKTFKKRGFKKRGF